jgi:hypothetical protein
VGVYGGFAGNEDSLYDRDWEGRETILDGRDGPDGTSHVYHVVVGRDDALIDGFTITGGRADHADDLLHMYGGGMGNIASSPTVQKYHITNNSYLCRIRYYRPYTRAEGIIGW